MAEIVVQLSAEVPELAITLQLPDEGASVWWVKEELCRQDPTGNAAPESFILCAEASRGLALGDGEAVAAGAVLLVLDGEEGWAAEEARRSAAEEAARWAAEAGWPEHWQPEAAAPGGAEAAWAEHWEGEEAWAAEAAPWQAEAAAAEAPWDGGAVHAEEAAHWESGAAAAEEAARWEREAAEAARWEAAEAARREREAAEAEEAARREREAAEAEEAARREREAAEAEEAARREREAAEAERLAREQAEEKAREAEQARQRALAEARRKAASRKPLSEAEKRSLEKQRVAVIVHGSRGDLQPFLSVCLGLLACRPAPAVKIFTDEDHCDSIRQFGIECARSTDQSSQKFLQTKKGVRAMTEGDLQMCFDEGGPEDQEEEDDWWDRQKGPPIDWVKEVHKGLDAFRATLILYNDLTRQYARTYSMTRDIPAIRVLLQPHGIPSNDIVPMEVQRRIARDPDTPVLRLWMMIVQWNAEGCLTDEHLQPEVPIRETPESVYDQYFHVEVHPEPVLCAYSGALWPAPPDWPTRNVEITGAWKVSKEEQSSRASKGTAFFNEGQHQKCQDFLGAGKPPVYLGWGSMMVHSAEYMTKLAVAALKAAGQRGIVLAGWAGLSPGCLPAGGQEARELREYCTRNVLFMKAAPHEWLFPQCACAVHHGGIGTTQASLGAGLPTVITPVFCDQFDIGEHVQKMEVGFATDQLAKVSPEEVGKAIRACCEDARYKANAQRLAAAMDQEDGVSLTCDLLRRFVAGDLLTGKWKRRHAEYKQSLVQRRFENRHAGPGLFKTKPWTTDLGQRYPVMAEYWASQERLFRDLEQLANRQQLWYVKAPSCLARKDKALGSDEAGRYLEFALLQELEREGSRLRVRRRKGVGPEEGWVSIALPGKEIVGKIDSQARLWEVIGLYNKARFETVRLGKKRSGR